MFNVILFWAHTWVCPYDCSVQCVSVGANPCVRPNSRVFTHYHCLAFFLGTHLGVPLQWLCLMCPRRGEPVCSPKFPVCSPQFPCVAQNVRGLPQNVIHYHKICNSFHSFLELQYICVKIVSYAIQPRNTPSTFHSFAGI